MKLMFISTTALVIALAAANCAAAKGPKGFKHSGPWHSGHGGVAQPLGSGQTAAGQVYRHGNRYYYVPNTPTSPADPAMPGTPEGQSYRLLRHGNRYQWVPADQYPDFVPPGQTFVPPGHQWRVPPPPPGTVLTGPGTAAPPVQSPSALPPVQSPTLFPPAQSPTIAPPVHHHAH